ncbi:MAG: DUF2938 domain-containing protein [Povalibacter sp.]
MSELIESVSCAVLIGVGATAVVDLWALMRKWTRGVPLPDYALVGRWLAHMKQGKFQHQSISASTPCRNERLIGWAAHYLVGIAFAALLLAIYGIRWAHAPTLRPALIIGISTVAAPFLLMQPGMGAGIAARRTSNPRAARVRSLVTHAVFGMGLYVAAWGTKFLLFPVHS